MKPLFSPDSKLQTAKGKELVAYLQECLFKPAQQFREIEDYRWLNYEAYYNNNCWFDVNPGTGVLTPVPVDEWREKISIPETFINHRAIKSLILNKDPEYTVVPSRNDEFFDVNSGPVFGQGPQRLGAYKPGPIMDAARAGQYYLNEAEEECHLKLNRDELVDDGLIVGNGTWVFGYDKSAKYGQGSCEVRRTSPYAVFYDPLTKNVKTQKGMRYWVIAERMGVDEIFDRYGKVVEPDNKLSISPFEEQLLRLENPNADVPMNTAMVYRYEIKEPISFAINGIDESIPETVVRTIITTDKIVLEDRYDPFNIDRFSVLTLQYNARPGQIYADGNIRHQMEIKDQLDKRMSHLVDSAKRMSLPRIVVGKAGFDEDQWNDEPGAILQVDESQTKIIPSVLQGASVGQDVKYIIDYHEKKMEDVVGLHGVSRGILPPGITSGRQLELAQAADTQVLGPYIKELERFMGDAARIMLLLVQKNSSEPIEFSYTDRDNGLVNTMFDPSQLDFSKVRVEISSYLANTKAARQDILLQLFQAGAIGREVLARGYEFPDIPALLEDAANTSAQAQRSQQLAASMPPAQPTNPNGPGLVAPQQQPAFG